MPGISRIRAADGNGSDADTGRGLSRRVVRPPVLQTVAVGRLGFIHGRADGFIIEKIAQAEPRVRADGCLVGKAMLCRFRREHPGGHLPLNALRVDHRCRIVDPAGPPGEFHLLSVKRVERVVDRGSQTHGLIAVVGGTRTSTRWSPSGPTSDSHRPRRPADAAPSPRAGPLISSSQAWRHQPRRPQEPPNSRDRGREREGGSSRPPAPAPLTHHSLTVD